MTACPEPAALRPVLVVREREREHAAAARDHIPLVLVRGGGEEAWRTRRQSPQAQVAALRAAHVFTALQLPRSLTAAAAGRAAAQRTFTVTAEYQLRGNSGSDSRRPPVAAGAGPFPPAVYPASWSLDYATKGEWISKYGADGYTLFGFDSNGTDVAFTGTGHGHNNRATAPNDSGFLHHHRQ